MSQRTESKAATVTISLGSFTVAGDFVLQLIRLESLGSELEESYNHFHPVADKFAMCTEPTRDAHACACGLQYIIMIHVGKCCIT